MIPERPVHWAPSPGARRDRQASGAVALAEAWRYRSALP